MLKLVFLEHVDLPQLPRRFCDHMHFFWFSFLLVLLSLLAVLEELVVHYFTRVSLLRRTSPNGPSPDPAPCPDGSCCWSVLNTFFVKGSLQSKMLVLDDPQRSHVSIAVGLPWWWLRSCRPHLHGRPDHVRPSVAGSTWWRFIEPNACLLVWAFLPAFSRTFSLHA